MISKNSEKSLSDQAYELIREMIVTGNLESENLHSVNALAESLNISRSPVSNACQRLESEGLLEIIPKQGIVINKLTLKDARDLYELRVVIETYAVENSIKNFNSEDIENLEKNLSMQKKYAKEGDIDKFMKMDIEFHKYILEKYTNQEFINIFSTTYDRMFQLGIENLKNQERLEDNIVEHEEILESLKQKDKDRAIKAVENNILNGYRFLTGLDKI